MIPDWSAVRAQTFGLWAFRTWMRQTKRPYDLEQRDFRTATTPFQKRARLQRLANRVVAPARLVRTLPSPSEPTDTLPRRIWLYWDTGEANAPAIVQHCIGTWRDRNPGWEVTCLSLDTPGVARFFESLPKSLGPAHQADVLRLALLAEHGGVWTDASVLCLQPLDAWLTDRMQAGFFAFRYPKDRPLSNWFLASLPDATLTRGWLDHTAAYWERTSKLEHYFVHHYLFEWMCLTQPFARTLWAKVPQMNARDMQALQYALAKQAPEKAHEVIQAATMDHPVQKLDWRMPFTTDDARRLLGPFS